VTSHRKGLLFGLTAYLLWGLFPLYWPLLEPAGAVEILANRIVWSLAVVAAILLVLRRHSWIRPLLADRRRVAILALAAATIALNWGLYIYGVNSGRVVETSLGYFINPLVTIVFGVVLLHEALRGWQWAAVGLGAVAVVVLTVDYGHPPWIALTLAFSFATYGLIKKTLGMDPLESLAAETTLLFVPALVLLVGINLASNATMVNQGAGHFALLASTGVVTAVPLLCFGAAAIRVPLVWLGLMQYLTPTMQFAIGVGLYNEPMPTSRWIGFALVWSALALIAVEGFVFHRRSALSALEPLVE